jgi:hypothetical protein
MILILIYRLLLWHNGAQLRAEIKAILIEMILKKEYAQMELLCRHIYMPT